MTARPSSKPLWLRGLPLLWVALLVGATALPAFLPLNADSFPFSTYPMFAKKRTQPRIEQARILLGDGSSLPATPELLGTQEVLQAKTLVRAALRGGKRARARLCRATAARVARSAAYPGAESVELVLASYEPVAYLKAAPEHRRPTRVKVRARCPVAQGRGRHD